MADNSKAGIRKRLESLRMYLEDEGYHFPNDLLVMVDDLIVDLGGASHDKS